MLSARLTKLDREDVFFLSLLFMTFYTAPLFSYSPIRFSDLGFVFLAFGALKIKKNIKLNILSISYLGLGIWAVVDVFFLLFFVPSFNVVNHGTQLIRLEAALFLFLLFPNYSYSISKETIINVLRKLLLFHVCVQLIYVFLYYAGLGGFFNIISNFDQRLALISHNNIFTNHFIIVNVERGLPRFSGFFEEPAWFGWNLSLLIGIILQYELTFKDKIITPKDWFIIVIAYYFTYSMSAYFSLFFIVFLYVFMKNRKKILKLLGVGVVLSISLMLFLLINKSIFTRLLSVFAGEDGSSSSRLLGSLNGFLTVLCNDPFTGYGLGDTNTSLYFKRALDFKLATGFSINGFFLLDMHIMPFQMLANLGVIGLFLFLLPFFKFIKNDSFLVFASFLMVFFSVNVFNSFFLFSMISVSFLLFNNYNMK